MSAGRICVREVDLTEPEESAQVAAQRMNDRNVGTLVVRDGEGAPVGIITDRDLAVRVVARGLDPGSTSVGEVMTACPRTVEEETSLETALSVMRSGPFRRLPVVDRDGRLVGLLSLDDILDLLTEEFNQIGELLRKESPSGLAAK